MNDQDENDENDREKYEKIAKNDMAEYANTGYVNKILHTLKNTQKIDYRI